MEQEGYFITNVVAVEHGRYSRVLIAALEEYEDSGTTQKEDVKKTLAKMLPSTHCMCTICIFVVNAVKVENNNISG